MQHTCSIREALLPAVNAYAKQTCLRTHEGLSGCQATHPDAEVAMTARDRARPTPSFFSIEMRPAPNRALAEVGH